MSKHAGEKLKSCKTLRAGVAGTINDRSQLEVWGAELERLARVIEMREIDASFASPVVSIVAKIQALASITEKLEVSFPVRSFIAVVAQHGRIPDLPAVAEEYGRMLDELMGRAGNPDFRDPAQRHRCKADS